MNKFYLHHLTGPSALPVRAQLLQKREQICCCIPAVYLPMEVPPKVIVFFFSTPEKYE